MHSTRLVVRIRRFRRPLACVFSWVVASALAMPFSVTGFAQPAAAASEIDSEHIFGITEGSDIGEKGEKEAESETLGRFTKRGGFYAATSTALALRYTLSDNFRVAPTLVLGSHNISGVP